MATAFVAGAALGYLIGGWVVAAVIPTFTALVVGLTVALGLRRRRRVARRASKVTH
jgi:ABC-type Mn2+/Zn2+ transport system permease subunit